MSEWLFPSRGRASKYGGAFLEMEGTFPTAVPAAGNLHAAGRGGRGAGGGGWVWASDVNNRLVVGMESRVVVISVDLPLVLSETLCD